MSVGSIVIGLKMIEGLTAGGGDGWPDLFDGSSSPRPLILIVRSIELTPVGGEAPSAERPAPHEPELRVEREESPPAEGLPPPRLERPPGELAVRSRIGVALLWLAAG